MFSSGLKYDITNQYPLRAKGGLAKGARGGYSQKQEASADL